MSDSATCAIKIFQEASDLAHPQFSIDRAARVLTLIGESLLVPDVDLSVIFTGAYGDAGGADYWAEWRRGKISAFEFAHFLAVHWLKESDCGIPVAKIAAIEIANIQPSRRMMLERLTHALGEGVWLPTDENPPSFRANGSAGVAEEEFYKIDVDRRRAIDWMLRDPAARSLVPSAYRTNDLIEEAMLGTGNAENHQAARKPKEATRFNDDVAMLREIFPNGKPPTMTVADVRNTVFKQKGREIPATSYQRAQKAAWPKSTK